MIKLLSPAGDATCLREAVANGCDEIYLGLREFSARKSAKNFSIDELKEAVAFCHKNGVSVNVALNTLIYESEFEGALTLVEQIRQCHADAIIVQDLGLAHALRKMYPKIRLHASTQLACHNLSGIRALEKTFDRIVLSRELSIEQIKFLTENTRLEIEVFIHGALCISVSGACLMSSFIGGRSGNRGQCAQPCRLPYSIDGNKQTLLSPKDLCGVDYVETLESIGVHSLKIEGRLKNPEYVATVTRYYRELMDNKNFQPKKAQENLQKVFMRGGGCCGYLKTPHNDSELTYFDDSAKISSSTPQPLPDIERNAAFYPIPQWCKRPPKNYTIPPQSEHNPQQMPKLYVEVRDIETAKKALTSNCDGIYLHIDYDTMETDLSFLHHTDKEIYFSLPLFLNDNELKKLLDFCKKYKSILTGLVCPNIGSAYAAIERGYFVVSDYLLYNTNGYAAEFLKEIGVSRITRSVEIAAKEKFVSPLPVEGVVHGSVVLMHLRHCMKKAQNKHACAECTGGFTLTDRTNTAFPVNSVKTNRCTLEILNSVELSTADRFDELPRLTSYRIIAHKRDNVVHLVETYRNCLNGFTQPSPVSAYTRGHWFKSAD